MSSPVDAINPLSLLKPGAAVGASTPAIAAAPSASFSQLLTSGVDAVNDKAIAADKLVRAFALDDNVPVHQVTFALMQSQLSLELMMQVRGKLVEGYQQLMNMQL